MSDESALRFYNTFGKFASTAANADMASDFDIIKELLNEIVPMFRLSKIIAQIYRNPFEERSGKGDTIVCFDTGIEGKPVHELRFVSKLTSIATMKIYMGSNEAPLSDDEFEKVDLTARTLLAFVSRSRFQDFAEELAFYDDDGFRNIRSLFN